MRSLPLRHPIVVCILVLGPLSFIQPAFVQPAWAQLDSREAIALQNQILELRREMQMLRDQPGRAGSPTNLGRGAYPPAPSAGGSDLVAQLLARVDTLEEQVRQLRGRTDETANQLQRMGADLAKRIDDMAFQTQGQRPQSGGPTPAVAPSPAGPPPQPGTTVRRSPEIAMQEGNAALARRDYAVAEQAAREVLTGSRTSPRAYDAQFLLAQALMGRQQFSQAAIAFDDAYNRARKGSRAQDALLGLANALIAINEKKAACETLGKLRAEYPTPRPDLRDVVTASTQRAGCR